PEMEAAQQHLHGINEIVAGFGAGPEAIIGAACFKPGVECGRFGRHTSSGEAAVKEARLQGEVLLEVRALLLAVEQGFKLRNNGSATLQYLVEQAHACGKGRHHWLRQRSATQAASTGLSGCGTGRTWLYSGRFTSSGIFLSMPEQAQGK